MRVAVKMKTDTSSAPHCPPGPTQSLSAGQRCAHPHTHIHILMFFFRGSKKTPINLPFIFNCVGEGDCHPDHEDSLRLPQQSVAQTDGGSRPLQPHHQRGGELRREQSERGRERGGREERQRL